MGYNERSQIEMSQELTPADIPMLISFLNDSDLRVGAQFALASQCEAAIMPVQRAVITDERVSSLDADDIMDLMADFSKCRPETQAAARAMRVEIDKLVQARQAQTAREREGQAGDDRRIQRNSLKMTDPQQRKTLSPTEREEAFHRAIKAAGLENIAPDDERLLKEIVLFADRSDIAEELTRLQSHFQQFADCAKSNEPVGRTLDFLAQEMNREINTIGSKANDAVISRQVVTLKAELEKFREQAQNVE